MTRSAPYVAMLRSLCDQEPRFGWLSALDSSADVACVCEEYPQEVDEGVAEALSVTALLEDIKSADVAHIGLKYAVAIAEAARHVIWHDVQEECDLREQYRADDWAERHPETAESAHGVAGLFRPENTR